MVLTMLSAPVAVATAAFDGLTLLGTYLQAWDLLGIQAALKYIPEIITESVATQSARLLGAINDQRNDVLTAISIGFPHAVAAPDSDASSPVSVSLARTSVVAGEVGTAIASMGQATSDALQRTLRAAADGVQSIGGAVTSGESAVSAATGAWRLLERQAGAGRRDVHDAIAAAGESFAAGSDQSLRR
jgi:hypothetical protein